MSVAAPAGFTDEYCRSHRDQGRQDADTKPGPVHVAAPTPAGTWRHGALELPRHAGVAAAGGRLHIEAEARGVLRGFALVLGLEEEIRRQAQRHDADAERDVGNQVLGLDRAPLSRCRSGAGRRRCSCNGRAGRCAGWSRSGRSRQSYPGRPRPLRRGRRRASSKKSRPWTYRCQRRLKQPLVPVRPGPPARRTAP